MVNREPPHALYRYWGQRDDLLYIGRTNDPMRRADEHRKRKDWITSAVRIDLEWVPADMVHEVERLAIQSEHPRYNIQHNRGRISVDVSAEVSVPSGSGLAGLLACSALAAIMAKWGFDAAANWSVRRRAARAGMAVELPSVRNPFTADPPSWSVMLLYASVAATTQQPMTSYALSAEEGSSVSAAESPDQ